MLWVSLTPRECNSFLIGGRLFLREMRHSIEVFFPPCLILYSPLTPHRYIKPCFLVLGLDFYHFNRSSTFLCPGSLEIYIY